MRSDAKAIEHDHVMGDVILDSRIESYRLLRARHQPRRGRGIFAGE